MRISEVRLRGCMYTLFPAAREVNVSYELMHSLLYAINLKAATINEFGMCNDEERENERKDPQMPREFLKEELKVSEEKMKEMIENGLLKKEEGGEKFILTEKSIDILHRAAEKQNKLDKEEFGHRGCCMHCF